MFIANTMERQNKKQDHESPTQLGLKGNKVLSKIQRVNAKQNAKKHLLNIQTKKYQAPINQVPELIQSKTHNSNYENFQYRKSRQQCIEHINLNSPSNKNLANLSSSNLSSSMLSSSNLSSSMPNQPMISETVTNASKFNPSTDNVFARIASRYDLICNLFSLGIHHYWKRRFIQIINNESWQNLLDIASGTGEIAYKLLKESKTSSQSNDNRSYSKVTNNHTHSKNALSVNTPSSKNLNQRYQSASQQIIVSDLSEQMLKAAEIKLIKYQLNTRFILLDAHDMTGIAANSQDVVSISMGLKLLDRNKSLKEAYRVLKPTGRLITMEVSIIPIAWLQKLYVTILSIIIPVIALFIAGKDRSVYRYLVQGMKDIPTADELAKEIQDIGFDDVAFERLNLGIVAIHSARKK